jgi:hypothetical protein
MGCIAMAAGLLVYAADREAAHAMLFPASAALRTGPIFGLAGPWLPSFIHPFAFSLFTAAARRHSASPAYGACAAWWAVNMAFEAAQHPKLSSGVGEALQLAFGRTGLTRAVYNYLLGGSFALGDIAAATAGALAAAAVLHWVHNRETRHAH